MMRTRVQYVSRDCPLVLAIPGINSVSDLEAQKGRVENEKW
jgi:hypothetical protein